jgi:hypothetical protein
MRRSSLPNGRRRSPGHESGFEEIIMLLVDSILAGIARLNRRRRLAGKLPWAFRHRTFRMASSGLSLRAKRFLTLDITDPKSGETRSFGLYLMPHAISSGGTRGYGATILEQSSIAYSARFFTDGRNCLIVFVGDTDGSSIQFQMRPWSRTIVMVGTLPNAATLPNDKDVTSPCVRQHCDAARSIIAMEHPTTQSDVSRIRRRVARLLHPDLGPAMEVACRGRAMAMMNSELDALNSRFAA